MRTHAHPHRFVALACSCMALLAGACSNDDDLGMGDARVRPDTGVPIDSGHDDAAPRDTGPADTGPRDTGIHRDAGEPDASMDAGDAGTLCTISGIYEATLMGFTIFFQFDDTTGTWVGAQTRAELMTNPGLIGTFMYSGGQLTIRDEGCLPTDVGQYSVAFTPACDTFTLTLIADTCTSRAMALTGSTFVR